MNLENFTDFKLPKNAYLSFDANSLKDLIIERLNENESFTDQNFEGSNFSAFIDVVAYMYHVLLFYLNTTSNESTFTTASIYENMSKLVSNIGYKPLGDQTSLLNFDLQCSDIPSNIYTVPKFSSVVVDSVIYHTLEDITFEKVVDNVQESLDIDYDVLHQGRVKEAVFSATGEKYEVITLIDSFTSPQVVQSPNSITRNRFISDNTFRIYVQNSITGQWVEWSETSSLFLENPNNTKYEKVYNSNGNYEFKFGDGNNGKALKEGDKIVIFYIESDNESGLLGANATNGKNFNLYTSKNFDSIKEEIYKETNLITPSILPNIVLSNKYASTPIKTAESVEEIRQSAPGVFSTQNRLVTKEDYEYQINRQFGNITRDVKILSNEDFTSQVLFYFNNIGINKGIDDARTLLSQVDFSTSTNFNNVYVYTVRTGDVTINERVPNYLSEGQKRLIANFCREKKDITHNVVIMDPIFKAFSFGAGEITSTNSVDSIINNSSIELVVDRNVAVNDAAIRSKVANIISTYFYNINLGDIIDVAALSRDILNIDGVEGISTRNGENVTPNLSFIIWNPDYRKIDSTVLARDYKLKDFEYAYFYRISDVVEKINIRRV